MANNLYTTKTAALKATRADVRDLNTKKMLLNGKNILDYISDSEFNSYDTRDPQLKNDELDVWNTAISLSEEGHIEVKPFEHTSQTIPSTTRTIIRNAFTVRNNEVFDADNNHVMYWQTDGLTDGEGLFMTNVYSGEMTNIVTFDSDMPSLTNAIDMFSITPSLISFNGDLSSLVEGENMFYTSELTSFTSDLSSLQKGNGMFAECYNLTDFKCNNLDSLTHGSGMFFSTNITSFEMNLSSLVDGDDMFNSCYNFTTFNGDLGSLKYGSEMFFWCENLSTFNGNLSSLVNGNGMFAGCSSLTSFTSPIPSLNSAKNMFEDCKLDAPSVANIVHALPQRDNKSTELSGTGHIHIGIGCDNTEADQLLFAQECDCETWQELLDEFDAKNWTVTFQYTGRPTTTYNMRRGETLPIYAKLEEVIMPTDEKERKPHYAYTSQDGSKFFNINYFHSTNGSTEGYDVFSSLEEAISTYNVTPKN